MKQRRNLSMGNHSADSQGLEAVITAKVTPTPKPCENHESNTAYTRICEGSSLDSQANIESIILDLQEGLRATPVCHDLQSKSRNDTRECYCEGVQRVKQSSIESKEVESHHVESNRESHSIDSQNLHSQVKSESKATLDSQVSFSQKGVFPSPRSPQPRKSLHFFGNRGESLALPCLVKNAKNALLHFLNAFSTPRQGRDLGASHELCNKAKPCLDSQTITESTNNLESKTTTKPAIIQDSVQGFAQLNQCSVRHAPSESVVGVRGEVERGEGATSQFKPLSPLAKKETQDSKKSETIRENEILKNENQQIKQNQNLDCFAYARNDALHMDLQVWINCLRNNNGEIKCYDTSSRNDNMSDTIDSHKSSAFFSNDSGLDSVVSIESLGSSDSKTNTESADSLESNHILDSLHTQASRKASKPKPQHIAKLLCGVASVLLLTACVPRITDVPQDSQITLNLSQSQESVNAHWWEDFHNPALLSLLTNAREFHTQNKLAKTQIEAAKNALKIARATLFPSLDANIAPAYNQTILHSLYGLAQGSLDLSYHFDFFGKYKYARRSKHYALQASIVQSYATRLSIDMLVAKTYISLLALQSRLELLYTTLEARKRELTIIEDRKKVGYISAYDAQQAVIQYESVKTQIAQTSLTIAKTKNALQYLTGVDVESEEFVRKQGFIPRYARDSHQNIAQLNQTNMENARNTSDTKRTKNSGDETKNTKSQATLDSVNGLESAKGLDSIKGLESRQTLQATLDSQEAIQSATYAFNTLQAPKLPDYLSSKLLNNRPDVLYAEFMLASSSEYLKKARADFLPDFNIGLSFGAAGLRDFTQFLLIGGVSGSILAPLFKGGELKGAFGIANAQRDEAAYIYRDVVIRAYQEARDAYAGIKWIDSELESLKKQEEAAHKALKHAKERYDTGYSSYLEVIDAQRSLLEIQIGVISAQTLYLESMVNLYGALGGGIEYPKELLEEGTNRDRN